MNLEEAKETLRQFHKRTGATHYHSSLSALPVLLQIKEKMRPGDIFILSKAHAITAYLLVFEQLPDKAPVQSEFGALGSGLPFALGVAYMNPDIKVYVLMGDGETQEGSVWEAMFAASRLRVTNLELYVDKNGMQGMGNCESIVSIGFKSIESYKGPDWTCHYKEAE